MRIRYSISLWNFTHYSQTPSIERIIDGVREQGYGIELWPRHPGEDDLYDAVGRKRFKNCVQGMTVSLHTAGAVRDFDGHRKQIDAAADYGAEVIVLHQPNVAKGEPPEVDVDRMSRAVEYARGCGVRLALENGRLEFCRRAVEAVPGLGFCLDTGHVYGARESMAAVMDAMKGRLIHIHLQDILPPMEQGLLLSYQDHYLPGTGGIPSGDWGLIRTALADINYDGIIVFEVRPRSVVQLAREAKKFAQDRLM